MNTAHLSKILKFIHEMYKVKKLLRFKGASQWKDKKIDRWDSVAEHSYRMALMAVLLAPYLKKKVNLEKALKIILVHDIVEILAKDYNPVTKNKKGGGHAFSDKAFQDKYKREITAAGIIFKDLPKSLRIEFLSLFNEYINTKANEKLATEEGKFAYALDKIEAQVQVIDWSKEQGRLFEENFHKFMQYAHEWSDYDPALKKIVDLINMEALEYKK